MFAIIIALCSIPSSIEQPLPISATIAYSSPDSSGSTCPSQDTINEEHNRIRDYLLNQHPYANRPCYCGGPSWTRVAHLNMEDTNQQCPTNWTLTTSPVRGCGRSSNGWRTCDSVIYPVNGRNYSSVCGRIIAYQRGDSFAFANYVLFSNGLDQSYLSGVSVTHGPAGNRTHIWSFVGAFSESPHLSSYSICPCINNASTQSDQIPFFINNNYFCDAVKNGRFFGSSAQYYTEDPLWDGEGCGPTSTCCSFNSPPWFCNSLIQPTSDDLEIRLCHYYNSQQEDKLISRINIYVQ